jgi:TPR repeat protein
MMDGMNRLSTLANVRAHGRVRIAAALLLFVGARVSSAALGPELLEKARQGDPASQYTVARAYYLGEGVPRDYAKAAEWFRKAAERGDAKAQRLLATMLVQGQGVPADAAAAFAWFQKAAAQGDIIASANLGWMHFKGIGTAQSTTEAIRHYRVAAKAGQTDAQVRLAEILVKPGEFQDLPEAARYLEAAATKGLPGAQNTLGVLFETGAGVEKDEQRAVQLFRAAAEQGEPRGQMNLGRMYDEGKGVAHDPVQACLWLSLSVEQKEIVAVKYLENLLATKRVTPGDLAAARKLATEFRPKKAGVQE